MMKHLKKLVLGCLLLLPGVAFGQQVPLINQYFTQPTLAYPSAAVFQDKAQLSLLYRGQWSGVDGAPQVFSLSFANPFKQKLGYNVNVNSFESGLLRQTNVRAGLAKAWDLKEQRFSLGAEVGLALFSLDDSRVSVESMDDELIRNLLGSNGSSASLNLSLSYQYKGLQVNAGVPNVLNESLSDDEYVQLSDNNSADYLVGVGYQFSLDQMGDITFTPNITWRYQELIGSAVDVLALFEWQRKFQLMAAYRDGYGLNAGVGVRLKPNILFTYNCDFGKKETPIISNGFNEVGLHFSFNKKASVDKDEALSQEASRIINRLEAQEIYDKKLIATEDQETVVNYYSSLHSGNKKERRAEGEADFDSLLEDIKQKGLERMRAEARARAEAAKADEEVDAAPAPVPAVTEEPEPVEEPTGTSAAIGRYILVVAAYNPGSEYTKILVEKLRESYPEAGIYSNELRGYDYVYVLKFEDRAEAISTMRELRKSGDFPEGWIHIVQTERN
ncbi:PorP/SprF family type IX secretion system membrane protein [Roseivirga pacifica]|uniref:PorP/SprF family type IX secretion system membrane protein n=1 Tax=Roseivirga pacifica TaxID=1267423 RepID=UPI0020957487|nr:PorP/SprF family type IX secretion system membrane protein [Roseivirga pacifica]MCO6360987.1 type IX secretion system membrane protein PorP/SprF [Roseivirga pacifica]MCO6368876.1 type IX secretion system membrane protein PorP/SprF [Roseivirga pacifica]MCO6373019.1 type IX secretion system membrane protein PorP/SprF [Roseivirga pacifica]MCO6373099.1 type IX secretion system membrane protein PorP/SprF [Roseivirga pacifica]MCO6377644.1 type IX secretion system membrane protein PorP/SprF [Rosei